MKRLIFTLLCFSASLLVANAQAPVPKDTINRYKSAAQVRGITLTDYELAMSLKNASPVSGTVTAVVANTPTVLALSPLNSACVVTYLHGDDAADLASSVDTWRAVNPSKRFISWAFIDDHLVSGEYRILIFYQN